MATKKCQDSDSDEYEVMSPNTVLETLPTTPEPPKKEKHQGKKKKRLFRRISKSKHDDKPAFTPTAPLTSSCSAQTTALVQSVPLKHASSQEMALPAVGPKPPRKLSDQEKLRRIRQQQKEVVTLAKRDRLRRSSETSPARRAQSQEYLPDYTVDRSYGELAVEDILNQYSDHLPLEVVVSKGTYGMEERYSLASSDRCVIHFIKRRELVQIQDPLSNQEFSVPVNSAIKFGVIYSPNNADEQQAMEGRDFPYVSDILAEPKLPKMGIARLQDPDIIGMKSMEILVPKQVIFPENPMDPRKLRVYSITAQCQRDLPETQEVHFNTKPSLFQLYLTDILKHVPDPCPLHVALYRNPQARPLVAAGMPSTMFRRQMYLKKRYTDILLIATGCLGAGGEGEEAGAAGSGEGYSQPFEIPTDIDVEFEVIKLSQEEKEKLSEKSRLLKDKLNDKDVRHHRYVGVTDEQHRMQMSLYKSVREGREEKGVPSVASKGTVNGTDDDYVRATSGNRLAMEHRVELLEENMKRCSHSLAEAKVTISTLNNDNTALSERVRDLEETVQSYKEKFGFMESLGQQLDALYREVDEVRGSIPGSVDGTTAGGSTAGGSTAGGWTALHTETDGLQEHKTPPTSGAEAERNIKLLSSMSKSEVLRMVNLAGLGQYAETIEAEELCGDILVECNEEVLERDLGIKSKLHRVKFIRIIEGKASPDLYQLVD